MASAAGASDTDLDSILLELSWALFAVTFIVFGLRFYSDLFIVRSFKLPSFIALLAFLIALASQILITCALHYNLGKHIDSLSQRQVTMALTYIWQAQPVQLLANTAGKVAIAALLVTLHGPKFARAKTIFIWTLAGIQSIVVVIAIALIYAQCNPVAKLWRTYLPGTCNGRGRNQNFAYVQGGISSFIDLALAIYPIVLFWDLRIKLLKKLVLSVLFAFGIVACISALVRTVNISRLAQTQDVTHAIAKLVIWNTTEMYLVLLAGSLPGLRPIFNKRMRTSSSSYQHSSYAHDHPPSSAPHNKNNNANKKHMVLKLSSLPSNNRSKVYASTGNHNRNDEDGDSTENILNGMGYRDTVKMAEVDIRTGRHSGRGQAVRQQGTGPRSRDREDVEGLGAGG